MPFQLDHRARTSELVAASSASNSPRSAHGYGSCFRAVSSAPVGARTFPPPAPGSGDAPSIREASVSTCSSPAARASSKPARRAAQRPRSAPTDPLLRPANDALDRSPAAARFSPGSLETKCFAPTHRRRASHRIPSRPERDLQSVSFLQACACGASRWSFLVLFDHPTASSTKTAAAIF